MTGRIAGLVANDIGKSAVSVALTRVAIGLCAAQLASPGHAKPDDAPMSACEDLRAAADGIEQALLRFAAGQDLGDPDLLGAAFSDDASLDFTQPADQLGASAKIMHGR